MVDLVTVELRPRLAVGHAHELRRLARLQFGHEVEQTEAGRLAAALDAVGIAHAPTEDLEPSADAEHRHAGLGAP